MRIYPAHTSPDLAPRLANLRSMVQAEMGLIRAACNTKIASKVATSPVAHSEAQVEISSLMAWQKHLEKEIQNDCVDGLPPPNLQLPSDECMPHQRRRWRELLRDELDDPEPLLEPIEAFLEAFMLSLLVGHRHELEERRDALLGAIERRLKPAAKKGESDVTVSRQAPGPGARRRKKT